MFIRKLFIVSLGCILFTGAGIALSGKNLLAKQGKSGSDPNANMMGRGMELGERGHGARKKRPKIACYFVGSEKELEARAEINSILDAALSSSVRFDFEETPLSEILEMIQVKYSLEIMMDNLALKNAGGNTESPITIILRSKSLRTAIRRMLDQIGLTFIIKNGVLLITTPTGASEHLSVAIYPVGDLDNFFDTPDLITTFVEPESWDNTTTIKPWTNNMDQQFLIISQTDEGHRKIKLLLRTLRSVQQ